MTIVLPILDSSEAALALKSLQWTTTLCGRLDAKLLVVCGHEGIAPSITKTLRALFENTAVLASAQVGLDKIWEEVYWYFQRAEIKEPWFWYEPDFTLLRPDVDLALHAIKPHVKLGAVTSRADFLNRDIFHTTESKTFPTLKAVHDTVDFRIPFHRGCEDGSVIDRLSEERNSTAVNVPNHFENVEYFEPKIETPPGTVDILIVTYKKDFQWLEYCLKAINKFATRFRQTIIAVPEQDHDDLLSKITKWYMYMPTEPGSTTRLYPYKDAPPGKGFVMHAAKICQSDLITDADYVLHMDADCIMKEPNDAGHYFQDGKPVMVWRPYESLKGPKLSGVVQDCYQWKAVSEQTLGMPLTAYTMCRHPAVFPRTIYKPFRDRVEEVQGVPFEQWCIAQKNTHPQSIAEFPSLGGFCYERLRNLFTWVDCMSAAPRDLMQNFWSHGGLDQQIGEGWLNGKPETNNAEKNMTARTWIEGKLA